MALNLGKNSDLYKYGSRTNIEFIFTKDHMFGLQVINSSLDSYYLYVNIDASIDPSSPLGKFIEEGFIIKVGENDSFQNTEYNEGMEIVEDDLDTPIMLQYQKRPGVFEDIEGGYYKYRFHRPLLDLRYNEKNERIPENENALNENDCLNFGECSTAKYIGLEKNNITAFPYQYQTSVLQSKETKNPFGISDELNMEMLKNIPPNKKNDNAIPEKGECYAMVRKEYRESVMYHIAFCIYTHNGVNITLEANADNGREFLPAFGFYDRNPNGFTFYKRYISIYDNGETIVLEGRDINKILKEIGEEVIEQVKSNTSMDISEEANKQVEPNTSMDIGGRKRKNNKSGKKQIKYSLRSKSKSNKKGSKMKKPKQKTKKILRRPRLRV